MPIAQIITQISKDCFGLPVTVWMIAKMKRKLHVLQFIVNSDPCSRLSSFF